MNERIKLPPQDWLGYDPERGDIHGYTFEQMRKFAELIVRECVSMCESVDEADIRYRYDYRRGVLDCADTLRQHFGVEE